MNEPDVRLRNMLVAAQFLPVGVLPTETPDGDVVFWDTWLSLTHLHVPCVFRTVGYGGVVGPLYALLARLASTAHVYRACGVSGGDTQLAFDIAVRLAPDMTEIAEVKVIRTDITTFRQMMLSAPLVPWFDPAWYEDDGSDSEKTDCTSDSD